MAGIFSANLNQMTIVRFFIVTMERIAQQKLAMIMYMHFAKIDLTRSLGEYISCILQIYQIIYVMIRIQIPAKNDSGRHLFAD